MEPYIEHEFNGWLLILDAAEVIPHDPGDGCPALVESPDGETATFFRAVDTGEIGEYDHVPEEVWRWLDGLEDEVDEFLHYWTEVKS